MNTMTVFIESLDREVVLNELTQEYRIKSSKDDGFDTPLNALINAGLSKEDALKIGQNVAKAIYQDIVELTYPEQVAEIKRLQESGEYTPPTKEDIAKSKKNS